VRLAAGELPQQIGVDRAEGELAGFRRLARVRHIVEQPGDLGGGEIRIEQQSGAVGYELLVARTGERRAGIVGAAILPDDRIVDRLAGGAVPDDGRLALVGDPDRRDVLGRHLGARHRGARGRDRRSPDALRVMLDPARRRIDLREFELREPDRAQRFVEQKRARGGRALVDRKQMTRQLKPPTSHIRA
jgi:hypothetical protein